MRSDDDDEFHYEITIFMTLLVMVLFSTSLLVESSLGLMVDYIIDIFHGSLPKIAVGISTRMRKSIELFIFQEYI